MARNSVGENAYVADEVLTARSKARVRVNNTDNEGRMVMADVLCKVMDYLKIKILIYSTVLKTSRGHVVDSH